MDVQIWSSLPQVTNVKVNKAEHVDAMADYSDPQKAAPYGIWSQAAEFSWDGILFRAKKEWFGAPRNPHLFVFRQTVETMADCTFDMSSWLEVPGSDSEWKFLEYLEQENNACGLLLEHRSGQRAALCETSQILSFSFHVDEGRQDVTRSYHLEAFEESPIKLEKYVSLHTDEESDFVEAAFRECREASKIRFEDLKGIGSWDFV